jgi:hypothetical protein
VATKAHIQRRLGGSPPAEPRGVAGGDLDAILEGLDDLGDRHADVVAEDFPLPHSDATPEEILLMAVALAQVRADQALARRDRLVLACADRGITAYKIAKRIGWTQPGVIGLLKRMRSKRR